MKALFRILIFSFLLPTSLFAQNCKEIVGYYPNWQWYDRNKLVNPTTIDYSKYTVINYAFFKPETNGTISGTDSWADDNLLNGPMNWQTNVPDSTQSLAYRCHVNNVKFMASVGGWTLSDNFPQIAASATKRAVFAHACLQLISSYHFDGIDIDWEYPCLVEHSGTIADKQNFTTFLQQIRDSLNAKTLITGKTYYLSAALPAGPDNMNNLEWGNIASILSFLNIMTYDFFGAWDNSANHNCPLKSPTQGTSTFNCDSAISKILNVYNVPANKVNMGVAFYGRSAKTLNAPALFGAIDNHQVDNATFSADDGCPLYYNILPKLNLFTQYWDSSAKVPYLLGNVNLKTFVSFDDTNSIALKAQYINNKNLRGAIIWEITGDYIETSIGSGVIAGTPMVNKLNAVMCGATITNCNPTSSTTNIMVCSTQLPYTWNSINYTSTGIYTLHFINSGGCDSAAVLNLSVYSFPSTLKIKTTGAVSVCEPEVVNLVLDHAAGTFTGCSFQWNLGGASIVGATDSFYNANASGNYTVTISSLNGNCFKSSGSKSIAIKTKPLAVFSASGATTFCAGSSVTLTAPVISGYTYYWLKDGINFGSGSSKVVKLSGDYNLIVKLNGCYDTSDNAMNVAVNPLPVASIAALDSIIICAGDSTTLQAMPLSFGNLFYWYNGNVLLDSSIANQFEAKTTGNFKVMVKDNNGCLSKVSATMVKEKVRLVPNPIITPLGSTAIPSGGYVKLKATPSMGVIWQWNKNGVPISGATYKGYVATQAGDYTLFVNLNGCTATSSIVTVTMMGNKKAIVENDVIAYPNPVKDELTMKFSNNFSGKIVLYDISGKQIKWWKWTELTNEIQLDFKDVLFGIYMLNIADDSGNVKNVKLIKE